MTPCDWLKSPDGAVMHINRGRGGGRRKVCKFCGQKYSEGKMCDFPLEHGKTCDAEMCDNCARTLGRQQTQIGGGFTKLNDTFDVCPIHRDRGVFPLEKEQSNENHD